MSQKWGPTYKEHGDLVAVSSFLTKGKEVKKDFHFKVRKYQDMTRIRPVTEQLAVIPEVWDSIPRLNSGIIDHHSGRAV
jgi:hypothetical protein